MFTEKHFAEAFWSYQAEGPMQGHPAFFIRFNGCPVKCTICDTPTKAPEECIDLDAVKDLFHEGRRDFGSTSSSIIVLTGGEPLCSEDFVPTMDWLVCWLGNNVCRKVQLETSGRANTTNHNHLWKLAQRGKKPHIVCSPKPWAGRGCLCIETGLAPLVDSYKFLWHPGNHLFASKAIRTFIECHGDMYLRKADYWIQPAYGYHKGADLLAAIGLCEELGARLSLQTHKWTELP